MSFVGKALKPLFAVRSGDIPAGLEDSDAADRLKQVVGTVTECCHLTLFNPNLATLAPRLDTYDDELKGFAYEGAGVGLAALDTWLPWKRRTRDFTAGAGSPYVFAIYLGAGMGLARMRRNPEDFRVRLEDPLFSWVVVDGYGFHEGFFNHRHYIDRQTTPNHLLGYGLRAFDQGLGRSIWFATGATIERVVDTINSFPVHRRADLWSGVGLACTYTGGVPRPTIEELREAVGPQLPDLALGVVMAANARGMVGNFAGHNELACELLVGRTTAQSAQLAHDLRPAHPTYGTDPAYEQWRSEIRRHLELAATGSHNSQDAA